MQIRHAIAITRRILNLESDRTFIALSIRKKDVKKQKKIFDVLMYAKHRRWAMKNLGAASANWKEIIPHQGVSMETDTPDGKAQVWVEEKYGLVIKLSIAPKTGQPLTMVEVKQLSLAKPAASVFVLPPACAEAAKAPRVPTEAERIAAETGDNAQDFTDAMMPPPSENSCSVALRVVHAGSMEPITGFQIAIDTARNDVDHPPAMLCPADGPAVRGQES
jgi:hypothetical protein